MAETPTQESPSNTHFTRTEDARAMEYVLTLLWNHRTSILKIVVIGTLFSTLYALIMPQTYTSTVTILPPQREEGNKGIVELLTGSNMPFDFSSTLSIGARPSDMFVNVLKSRTMAESLIVRNNLLSIYGIDNPASWRFAIEPLHDASFIEAEKNGLILVTVESKTSYFASTKDIDSVRKFTADIANDYVVVLDKINREKLVSKARTSREYIELQLKQTRAVLDTAYENLVLFQQKNKFVSLEKQFDGMLRYTADLKTKLIEAEVELGFSEKDFSSSSRLLQDARARVEELRKQYNKLIFGGGGDSSQDYLVALSRLPEVSRDLASLIRELKVLEEVNLFLNRQYFKEKIQEARDLPTVQVLDPAIPAIQRTAPRRMTWALVSCFLSFVTACVVIIILDAIKHRTAKKT